MSSFISSCSAPCVFTCVCVYTRAHSCGRLFFLSACWRYMMATCTLGNWHMCIPHHGHLLPLPYPHASAGSWVTIHPPLPGKGFSSPLRPPPACPELYPPLPPTSAVPTSPSPRLSPSPLHSCQFAASLWSQSRSTASSPASLATLRPPGLIPATELTRRLSSSAHKVRDASDLQATL